MALVKAIDSHDRDRLVPEVWLEQFPDLFTKAPDADEAARERGMPEDSWTVAQMREWARPRGIDLKGLRGHAEILEAVTAAGSGTDNGSDGAGADAESK